MTRVECKSGICKRVAIIEVNKTTPDKVEIKVDSECEFIKELGEKIPELNWLNCLKNIKDSKLHKAASECIPHVACPVACAIAKAIEVEVSFALPEDVSIKFIN